MPSCSPCKRQQLVGFSCEHLGLLQGVFMSNAFAFAKTREHV